MSEETKRVVEEGFSPIISSPVHPEIRNIASQKSFEDKLYLILYVRTDEETNGFFVCTGRMDCYQTIDRLMHTYQVDIHNSVVLVEVPALNKNGKGEWLLKNPINAPSIYQFCKSVEKMFPGIDFSIDDYNDKPVEDDSYEPAPVGEQELRERSAASAVVGDAVIEAYKDMLDKQKTADADKIIIDSISQNG